MNIYVPFQLPNTFKTQTLVVEEKGFRVSTWFLSWDILLEPLHPGLIPPGTHHHGHYHQRCSPRRRQRPRRQGCAWRCWEPPGWRRRCGRNRWGAWRTDASAYPGWNQMLNFCWCWGLGGMDIKQCGDSCVFFSLKGCTELFDNTIFSEFAVDLSWVFGAVDFDVVFVFFPHYPPTKRHQGTNHERHEVNDATASF